VKVKIGVRQAFRYPTTWVLGIGLLLLNALTWGQAGGGEAQLSLPTVLHIATERHTSLALNYAYFPQFARWGFGTASKPWHPWFGTQELRVLLYLPDYQHGQAVAPSPSMIIGSRFGGKRWESGFDALRSFDTDQNGVVERDELNGLYVWVDSESTGELVAGRGEFFPCREQYTGFDLRRAAVMNRGYARSARQMTFAVLKRQSSSKHLLDLAIEGAFESEARGYLSYASVSIYNPNHQLSGEWKWQITDHSAWTDPYTSWRDTASGRLILAVDGEQIHGVVQYVGHHADRINLPLAGQLSESQAEWTSVSPMGLTHSSVTLDREFATPVLRGTAWSNRNGKVQRWTWKAYYDKKIN
jgi:hypothetical protein